jgi:hypothetical protein
MPDQTITLTLHEKVATDNFIKISCKDIDGIGSNKEIQLIGDQEKDNITMNTLFSELLPKTWIEQYNTINSQLVEQNAKKQKEDEEKSKQETNAEKLRNTKRGTFSSDKMSVSDIISALSSDIFKVRRFIRYVIKTLLNQLKNITNVEKVVKSTSILYEKVKGLSIDPFEKYINKILYELAILLEENDKSVSIKYNYIEDFFKSEFVEKYSGNITTWGREVQASSNAGEIKFSPVSTFSKGGNNSTQKTHKINNNKTAKKYK